MAPSKLDLSHGQLGARTAVAITRPPIMSRALGLVFVTSFGAMTSFYLLLSTVPLFATSVGADGVGAGLTTGLFMFFTVVTELATPRLASSFGQRNLFGAGLILLGAPSLALTASAGMPTILAVCAARGVGLAIVAVVGSALVASLVPRERRGEGMGLYGVVVGVPAVAALPLGVWLVGRVGYSPVFVAAAFFALAGLAAAPALPQRSIAAGRPLGIVETLRAPRIVRPSMIFSLTAIAAGVVVTFLPLALPRESSGLAAVALLAQAAAATVARWLAGKFADRHGADRQLVPAVVVAALGMLGAALTTNPMTVVFGMVLFGAGFGVAQNASLTLMLERVSSSGYDAVSALWNLAYDGGLGVGGTGVGVLAAQTGYPAAFTLTAIVMVVAGVLLAKDRAAANAVETDSALELVA